MKEEKVGGINLFWKKGGRIVGEYKYWLVMIGVVFESYIYKKEHSF